MIMEKELIKLQLSSVNKSLQNLKEDIEKLRVEAQRNISAVKESLNTLINDVRSKVAANYTDQLNSLNGIMNTFEHTLASHKADIEDLQKEVFGSGSGLTSSIVCMCTVAAVVMLYNIPIQIV